MRERARLNAELARLPPTLGRLFERAAKLAQAHAERLYLVGGVVRDLLLGRSGGDVDLVVEGDAGRLARELAAGGDSRVTVHRRFGTARLWYEDWIVDFASARGEVYPRPGALPTVRPSDITHDLSRRDFSINAMAISLNSKSYGEMIDPCRGQADLEQRLVRILHDKSFIDDATRIWRALRYEQRLGFSIEPHTLELLKRDIRWLESISADRIRYELDCTLAEDYPEKALRRAGELGVLGTISPALSADEWLDSAFERARNQCEPQRPPPELYLALLGWRLNDKDRQGLIQKLRMTKLQTRVITEASVLKSLLDDLASPTIKLSRVYTLLHPFNQVSLQVAMVAAGAEATSDNIKSYLTKWRYARTALSGADLLRLGVPLGPEVKRTLDRLLAARLDGQAKSREDETRLVGDWWPSPPA